MPAIYYSHLLCEKYKDTASPSSGSDNTMHNLRQKAAPMVSSVI